MTLGPESNRAIRGGGKTIAPAQNASPAQRLVLIVEDEPTIARLQTSFLAKIGLAAHSVGNGDEALDFLQKQKVDLIISDIRLPGTIDGLKLYQWVRNNKPELRAKFLFISGDTSRLEPKNLAEGDRLASLQKPFTFEEYRQAVSELLR